MIETHLTDPTVPAGQWRLTYQCPLCTEPVAVLAAAERVHRWLTESDPPKAQNLFPDMSPADREVLISGCHGKCFAEAFPP